MNILGVLVNAREVLIRYDIEAKSAERSGNEKVDLAAFPLPNLAHKYGFRVLVLKLSILVYSVETKYNILVVFQLKKA
jgi:hypothetical protein